MLCPKFLAHDLILMSDQNCDTYLEKNETTDNLFGKREFFKFSRYESEWGDFFKKEEIDLQVLRERSAEGKLRFSYFRSVIWRILLGILHKQPLQWLCQLQMYRKHYDELLEELNNNPWTISMPSDNPLSQESESVWQKYFCDEELKAVIQQDVRRTFPDIDYFRNENIQRIMIQILFCYARQNPVLCYRQGMHEILAPIILVLHSDHQAYLLARKQNPDISQTMSDVLSPEFLEHDAYSLFRNVMGHVQYSYKVNNLKEEQKTDESEIITRLDYIKKNIFQKTDPELCSHLEKLDIPMHLFGIRWLRLLFGREFPLQDLLVLWDFIFSGNFDNINYTVVAMLVAIREILLYGDYNTCLSVLMKYPLGVNISWIVDYVLHLQNPSVHVAPDPILLESFISGSVKQQLPLQILKRMKNYSQSHPKCFPTKENLQGLQQNEIDACLVAHGFVSNDTNFHENDVEQIKMVLSIVHYKLLEFHSLLKNKFPGNNNPDIAVIVDGIYELSCLLKHYNTCEIETACEAGENKVQSAQSSSTPEPVLTNIIPTERLINNQEKSHTLPRTRRGIRSGELKVFKHQIGGAIDGAPMSDPLHLIRNPDISREG